jgi:SAM-dependent methyltransferase
VTHIDDYAIAAVGEAYRTFLPPGGVFLDLMSSWVSHFPGDLPVSRLVGLGMNDVELSRNPRLDAYVVHDLNVNPSLPFDDDQFDGVVICVSVQYLTRPVEVFAEVARVLRPAAPLVVTYSNRCFQTKAVSVWLAFGDEDRGRLVALYAKETQAFDDARLYDLSPGRTFTGVPDDGRLREHIRSGAIQTDPLYAVVAKKRRVASQ